VRGTPVRFTTNRADAPSRRRSIPAGHRTILDIDVDLQLGPPARPGTVRRPDVVVVTRSSVTRRRRDVGPHSIRGRSRHRGVSAGSERTDRVLKHSEYADAGIPHHWVVDLGEPDDRPPTTLAGAFGHADAGPVSGVFTATEPFPVRIDLDALV
jgi:hypothetical protein